MPIAFTRKTKAEFLDAVHTLLRVGLYPGIAPINRTAVETHMAAMKTDPRDLGAAVQFATDELNGGLTLTLTINYNTSNMVLRQ